MQLFNLFDDSGALMKMGITISPLYRMPDGYRFEPYEASAKMIAEKAREDAMQQIRALEAQQARPLREVVLGNMASKAHLAAIDAQIAAIKEKNNHFLLDHP